MVTNMEMAKAKRPLQVANPRHAFLALEAKRFRHAFLFDPMLAMSVSKVDPLPHQIEAVYGHLLKRPRIRFMLAHDPGAGKTIMAGLAIKELKLRGLIRRILIVVPGQLKEQWRWELYDKFDEYFDVVDREYFDSSGGISAWDADQLVTSIDFAKQSDVMDSMKNIRFDLIIVDEAHKMSAYTYGNTTSKTRRYRLGEMLSLMSNHMLFLTATPHKGDSQNFRLLMDLLEPGFFADPSMMKESVQKQDNLLFLRRAKEDMVDFENNPLFVPRTVETPDVQMSPPERALYDLMSKYVKRQYNLAMQLTKNHNVTFALIILQRRFASSAYALLKSLQRRREKLADLESDADAARGERARPPADAAEYMEKIDEMAESERWGEEKRWEVISVAKNQDELRAEIQTLDGLIQKAEEVIRGNAETKLNQLKATMDALSRSHPREKMLVFTESKDTLDYLVERIKSWGYSVNTIHGSMPAVERKDAEAVFRYRTRVMVATEAAGEGINLQFCHLMINYDLPWNPNRLEQRMGRIHRYGQKLPVRVFNMVAADTREGEIMQTLFNKLVEIKEAMGSDKVFDVISDIVPGKSLSQMLLDATVRNRRQKEIISELADSMSLDNEQILAHMKDGLATKDMDHISLRDVRERAREQQLAPYYTEELFRSIADAAGGRVEGEGDVVSIHLPESVIGLARKEAELPLSYPEATFDKMVRHKNPDIELFSFGHPAFDAVLDWAEQNFLADAKAGSVFVDPAGRLDGHLVFCEGIVTDGYRRTAGKRLYACMVDAATEEIRLVSPSILLDLEMQPRRRRPAGSPNGMQGRVLAESALLLEGYMETLAVERRQQADAAQRYGMASLDTLLEKICDNVVGLLSRKRRGSKVDLPIYNKREDRRRYRIARKDLRVQIEMDNTLAMEDPSIVGIIRIVPGPDAQAARIRRALDAAVAFERRAGRKPERVWGGGNGFDIRSTGKTGVVRYILAKPADGPVALSFNEWFRAKMLGSDYYLYLMGEGKPRRIRNPAEALSPVRTEHGYQVPSLQLRSP